MDAGQQEWSTSMTTTTTTTIASWIAIGNDSETESFPDEHPDPFQKSLEEEAAWFLPIFMRLVAVNDWLEPALLWSGVLGNFFSLLIVCTSRHMRTASFLYYKCLLTSNLVYCLNFLCSKYVEELRRVSRDPVPVYRGFFTAFYIGVVSRVTSSVCGFLTLYATLAVSIDRFVALIAFERYPRFNRSAVAVSLIAVSFALSTVVNSWSPWFEKRVVLASKMFGDEHSPLDADLYVVNKTDDSDRLRLGIRIKDVYNGLTRLLCLIAMLVLTSAFVNAFVRRRRRRVSCRRQLRRRRDRCLFCLLIAALLLTYVQVIPRELKRAFELRYPEAYVDGEIQDGRLPTEHRLFYVRLYFYVYVLSTPIMNVCTAVERSMFFYLNIVLNYTFRREVWAFLRRLLRRHSRTGDEAQNNSRFQRSTTTGTTVARVQCRSQQQNSKTRSCTSLLNKQQQVDNVLVNCQRLTPLTTFSGVF